MKQGSNKKKNTKRTGPASGGGAAKSKAASSWTQQTAPRNAGHEKMLLWLRKVHFRRTIIGGVDEADVWHKLEDLDRLYEESILCERERYNVKLTDQTTEKERVISNLEAECELLRAENESLRERLKNIAEVSSTASKPAAAKSAPAQISSEAFADDALPTSSVKVGGTEWIDVDYGAKK